MRANKFAAISLEELCLYGNSPIQWANYKKEDKPPIEFWEQLRELVIAIVQEEFKWGKLPRISKYHVLDKLIIDKFPDNVQHRRLIEMSEKVEEKLPEGRKIGNLPGMCNVGRAQIKFKTDLCCIDKLGNITAIDFLPLKLQELPWFSQSYLDAKWYLLASYVPNLIYLIYSVAPGNQLKIQQVFPQKTEEKLYITLQFWHSGIVNRIIP